MPNVGRPSKGCKNCRDRKVKCDQKRPSCSQCLRIGKECHGYRDPLTMMFKNQSDTVARKAESRYQELSKQKTKKALKNEEPQPSESDSSSSSNSSSPFSPSSSHSSLPSPPASWSDLQIVPKTQYSASGSMTFEPMPSIEDQAIGFFFANHVVNPQFVPRGTFDFLHDLLNKPDTEDILQCSVNAASLAGFAHATKSPQVLKKAQAEYVSALRMTNHALQSTQLAKKDSTLVSVIMLGMYENFAYQNMDSMDSWAKHVYGACALLKLRGMDNWKTSVGLRVFQQFYGTILLVALETGRPVPDGISELWEMGTKFGDYTIHGHEWTTRMVRFMRDTIALTHDKKSDPTTMVDMAMKLDKELDSINDMMPNVWKFETVYLEEPTDEVYGNSYNIYLDPWVVQMWNNLRACRIFLHQIIRGHMIKGSEQSPPLFDKAEIQPQLKASMELIIEATRSICASVPQILGAIAFPDLPATKPSPSATCSDIFNSQDPKFRIHPRGTFLNPFRPTGMHILIWPLYAIAANKMAPANLRRWGIDILLFIALRTGTRQASVLAEDLKQKQKLGTGSELIENVVDVVGYIPRRAAEARSL